MTCHIQQEHSEEYEEVVWAKEVRSDRRPGEDCLTANCIICCSYHMLWEWEMGEECSSYEGEEKCMQNFGLGTERRDRWVDLGCDRKIILKQFFKKWTGMVWKGLIRLRDKWQFLIKVLVDLRVQQKLGEFSSSRRRVSLSRNTPLHAFCYVVRHWQQVSSPYKVVCAV